MSSYRRRIEKLEELAVAARSDLSPCPQCGKGMMPPSPPVQWIDEPMPADAPPPMELVTFHEAADEPGAPRCPVCGWQPITKIYVGYYPDDVQGQPLPEPS